MNDFGRDDKHRTGGNRVGPWSRVKTSALGQKQTYAVQLGMSALPSRADSGAGYISMRSVNVGSSPAAFELFTFRDTGYICSDL